jgi:hypothetical protein
MTLLLALLICVVGIVPAVIAGQALGLWHIRAPWNAQASATPSLPPDTALPRQVWLASDVKVLPQPGKGTPVATLVAGSPATLTLHRLVGNTSWGNIIWAGPTVATSGEGWVPDSALVAYGTSSGPLGDLGALSPALAAQVAGDGAHFSAAIYFPDISALYQTNAGAPFTLGDGFRAVLLVALLARSESQPQGLPPTLKVVTAALADGDASIGAVVYNSDLGGATGVTQYLAGIGVAGIQPAANWQTSQATASSMLQFYSVFAKGEILSSGDRSTALTALTQAKPALAASAITTVPLGSGGVLVAGVAQTPTGWTVNICGIVATPGAPHYVIAVALRDQASQAAAVSALNSFFQKLTALLASS